MKTALINIIILLLLNLPFPIVAQTKAERNAAEKVKVEKLLQSKRYVFEVTSVQPTAMISRQLAPGYSLTVDKDSLSSYLPYFGVAYSAPMNTSKSPLEFSSSDFTYASKVDKKGRTNISINPKDLTDPRSLNLSISGSGYATLYVISNNRQQISFYGTITPITERKPKR